MKRIGVIVHPTRPVQDVVALLREWSGTHDRELVQVGDRARQIAPEGEVSACELLIAIGGDGTVLRALHAAASSRTPVLGVARGSLGALTTVSAAALEPALERFAAGAWTPRELPALAVRGADAREVYSINDVVLFRRGGTQLRVELFVGDELYAAVAGDGVVVATALGSSAYSMAAGGPILLADAGAFVCTPLAMHGGNAPPLVVSDDGEVRLEVTPGPSGFELELDGRGLDTQARSFSVRTRARYATLVALEHSDAGITRLRRRGLIADSPRIVAEHGRPQ